MYFTLEFICNNKMVDGVATALHTSIGDGSPTLQRVHADHRDRRFLANFPLQLAGVGVRGRDSDPRRPKCLSKWAGQQIPRSGELALALAAPIRNTASVAGDQTVHVRESACVDPSEMATSPCTHGHPGFRRNCL